MPAVALSGVGRRPGLQTRWGRRRTPAGPLLPPGTLAIFVVIEAATGCPVGLDAALPSSTDPPQRAYETDVPNRVGNLRPQWRLEMGQQVELPAVVGATMDPALADTSVMPTSRSAALGSGGLL
jgi:hypothetical protein